MMARLQAELGPEETGEDSELESALNAVLESTEATEEPAATEAEVSEMPDEVTEAAPAVDPQKLELTLPAPGEGAGAVETNEAEEAVETP